MIHENIELTGSFTVSGSFVLPNHSTTASLVEETGSMYHDSVDGVLKVYTGTQWVTVGEQTAPAGGGVSYSTDIEYLLVAGGGAGGNTFSYGTDGGGGGGAGGLLSSSLSSVQSGSSFTVTVGAGGSQATNAQGGAGVDSSIAGATISTITATGGGGGGGYSTNAGGNGGSGGGSTNGGAAGSGTVGQGNDGYGGSGNANGGGGATQAGGVDQSPNGGQGGSGSLSYITGTATGYAGGGSGGSDSSTSTYTAGGYGGGGRGAAPGAALIGGNGTANTGGGGGGGSANDSYSNGGAGGSGVAIFAYNTGSFSGLGGVKTTRSDGYMVHTFNSSGTLTIAGSGEFPVANGSVFNTVLYTGTDASHAITGVGFQPDFVWIKRRNSSEPHAIYDSIRGINKQLSSDSTLAEATNTSPYEGFTSFDSDGFTVDNNGGTNRAPNTYVAWCWKAGGVVTPNNNTEGSITSTVSANQAAGFSIVKYTGNDTSNTTVGHGLSSAPEMIIVKEITQVRDWGVYHKDIGNTGGLRLNGTGQQETTRAGWWSNTTPSNSVFTLGGDPQNDWYTTNQASNNYIAYCFHSVPGYQKVGSYSGSSTSAITVTTGFKPRFLMLKLAVGTSSAYTGWAMFDYTRDIDSDQDNPLYANASYQEGLRGNGTGTADESVKVQFTDTGFIVDPDLNRDGETNAGNGTTYIYLAIA